MRHLPHVAAFAAALSMLAVAGCISTSDSGRVYLSLTPLYVIGGIILLVAFLRRK